MSRHSIASRQDDHSSEWTQLGSTIWKRFSQPFGKPTYVFYFLLSMIIGAVGVWIALLESLISSQAGTVAAASNPEVYQSILTFFAAVGSISCVQILIMEDDDKHLRVLFVLVLFLFIILAAAAAFSGLVAPALSNPILMTGTALAALTWWIANWDDGKFGQANAQAPLGGDPDDEAAGDTEGFAI